MELTQNSHIHLMGICGTGMAGLAGLLKEKGFYVTGSDQNMYPPMSNYIKTLGIKVMERYLPENLTPEPDLVIVGNVITKENPEAQELLRKNIPHMSFPEALREFELKNKTPIVVAGTHGKTTTSSSIAWILSCAKKDPGFLVGGIPINFQKNFSLGRGKYFVIEGDEYDTAFFDKRPKFLHYMPKIAIVTSIEFDHADIYKDYEHVLESFRSFVSLVPEEGILLVNETCVEKVKDRVNANSKIYTYGLSDNCNFKLEQYSYEEDSVCFSVKSNNREIEFKTILFGRHNLLNLTAAIAVCLLLGVEVEDIKHAVSTFKAVRRRLEFVGSVDDIIILDDFAHHPTAVLETINALKERYPFYRLIAVFEPRSNSSRRNVFQEIYPRSFLEADITVVQEPKNLEKIPEEERFSAMKMAKDLTKLGRQAFCFEDPDEILEFLTGHVRPGDVVLFMSNGDFNRLPQRLFEALIQRGGHKT